MDNIRGDPFSSNYYTSYYNICRSETIATVPKISIKMGNCVLPWRSLFGVSVNESRWLVSDKEVDAEVVIADTDPVNEGPLVSAEALFRPPPLLCPLLVVVLSPLPVAPPPLTIHPGFA